MRVDLHMHSTASDGSLSPGAVADAARAGGLDVIALADHDTASGVAEAQAAAVGAVHVIPAIEMSTLHNGSELHILGYFIDPRAPRLLEYAGSAGTRREERMRGMIALLGSIGVAVDYGDVLRGADTRTRSIGRPHLARALVERGHVSTMSEAFDRYIGDGGPAYMPVRLLSSEDAIALIHEVGGVAIWAHPRPDAFDAELHRLVGYGLDGVECFRPRCPPAEAMRLDAVSREFGLLVTGGSDWHGAWHGRLGDFAVGRDEVGAFLDRGGI
jgi:3',5'-nucleoside bisphosphate phosphatase